MDNVELQKMSQEATWPQSSLLSSSMAACQPPLSPYATTIPIDCCKGGATTGVAQPDNGTRLHGMFGRRDQGKPGATVAKVMLKGVSAPKAPPNALPYQYLVEDNEPRSRAN